MLSEKPWKADAVMRLGMSVVICFFIGQFVILLLQCLHEPKAHSHGLFFVAFAGSLGFCIGALWLLTLPWRIEQLLLIVALLPMCLFIWLIFTWWAAHLPSGDAQPPQTTPRIVAAILSVQGAALIWIHRFIREHQITWAEAFGLKNNWTRALLLGATVAVVIVPTTQGIMSGTVWILKHFRIQPEEQVAVQVVRTAETPLDQIILALATIIIAPVAEEMLFRGILYPAIKRAGFPRMALWGSAAAFAAIHFDAVRFLPLMVLALALIWVYEQTNNLLACITTHSLFNATTFVLLLRLPQAQL